MEPIINSHIHLACLFAHLYVPYRQPIGLADLDQTWHTDSS